MNIPDPRASGSQRRKSATPESHSDFSSNPPHPQSAKRPLRPLEPLVEPIEETPGFETHAESAFPAEMIDATEVEQDSNERNEEQLALVTTARQLLKDHDYRPAVELLQSIPPFEHTDESLALLHEAEATNAECDSLMTLLDDVNAQKDTPELVAAMRRLLELKPGYLPAETLLHRLENCRDGWPQPELDEAAATLPGRRRRRPKKLEEPVDALFYGFSYRLIGSLLFGVAVMAVTFLSTVRYLTSREVLVAVEVDDPSAEVFIKDKPVHLEQGLGMVHLLPGDYKWSAGKEGKVVASGKVSILKDHENLIRISLENGTATVVVKKLTPQSALENLEIEAATDLKNWTFEAKAAGAIRKDNFLKMRLIWCPAGQFRMGSNLGGPNESPVDVTLSNGFWMAETEITQGQWQKVMGTTPWKGKSRVKEGEFYPATFISHGSTADGSIEADSARAFCKKFTEDEQKAGRLPEKFRYTLPTEAQWEYACRAGSTDDFGFGNEFATLLHYGWFSRNAYNTADSFAHEVGMLRPNDWGLRDMHGNLWEWCADRYQEQLPGGQNPMVNGPGGMQINRGGSWVSDPLRCRSAYRGWNEPQIRNEMLGFRVVLISETE